MIGLVVPAVLGVHVELSVDDSRVTEVALVPLFARVKAIDICPPPMEVIVSIEGALSQAEAGDGVGVGGVGGVGVGVGLGLGAGVPEYLVELVVK